MPKTNKGEIYKRKYTDQDLEAAIEATKNGMSKRAAAKTFGVPRGTLQFRLHGNFVKDRPGPSTVLTKTEEDTLVEWIIESCKKSFPRRKEDVLQSVTDFLKQSPRPNSFIDNKPGEGWYRLFLSRHPKIVPRTAEAVTSASANVSEVNIRKWFEQIETYLKEENLFHVLQDPKRVFNGDETNFLLCPKTSRVLAPKGVRDVYEVDNAPAKSGLTVMFTFSANGVITPPMIIYPLKRNRADIAASVPPEWGIGLSSNGWMNQDLFLQYIKQTENKPKPIVDYKDFIKIVGPNIVSCLVSETPNETNRFFSALKDVHDHLRGNSSKQEAGTVGMEYLVVANKLMPINDIPIVISSENTEPHVEPTETANCLSTDFFDSWGNEDFKYIQQELDNPCAINEINTDCFKEITVNVAEDTITCNLNSPKLTMVTDIDTPEKPSETYAEQNKMPPAMLKDTLKWPLTPQRKGRIISKNPLFVLTSRQWLEIEENKKKEKETREKDKENRKKERAEKKKQADKRVTKNTKIISITGKTDHRNREIMKTLKTKDGEDKEIGENCSENKEDTQTDKDLKRKHDELDISMEFENRKKSKDKTYNIKTINKTVKCDDEKTDKLDIEKMKRPTLKPKVIKNTKESNVKILSVVRQRLDFDTKSIFYGKNPINAKVPFILPKPEPIINRRDRILSAAKRQLNFDEKNNNIHGPKNPINTMVPFIPPEPETIHNRKETFRSEEELQQFLNDFKDNPSP